MDAQNNACVKLSYGGKDLLSLFSSTVDRADIIDEVDEYKRALITISDTTGRLEAFLSEIQSPYPLPIKFRYGFSSGTTTILTPEESWLITDYRTSKNIVVVELVDTMYFLTAKKRTVARKGQISDIVHEIFSTVQSEHGISTAVIIEPTKKINSLYYQSNLSDWDFLKLRMRNYASNSDGCAGYHIINRFGTWIFANFDYAYASHSISNALISGAFKKNKITQQLPKGAAGITRLSYDPRYGSITPVSNDEKLLLQYSQISPSLNKDFSLTSYGTVGVNGLDEERSMVQNEFSSANEQLFAVSFGLSNTVDVRPGDLINATINADGEANKTWNGLWSVRKVQHVIAKGSLNTQVTVIRGDQTRVYNSTPKISRKTFRKSTLG